MFWNEEAECMSKEKKEELQLERLQKTVKHAYDNIEFYKKRFDKRSLSFRITCSSSRRYR